MSRSRTTSTTLRRVPAAGALIAVSALAALAPSASAADGSTTYPSSGHAAAPASKTVRPFIVGGTRIPIARAPYQVYVEQQTGANSFEACGGSIIDSTHILTASHCVYNGQTVAPFTQFRVLAGVSNLNPFLSGGNGVPAAGDDPQLVTPIAVASHPNYRQPAGGMGTLTDFQNDVAVLTLAPGALQLRAGTAATIPLPTASGANPAPATPSFVSGFGLQQNGAATPDGFLYGLDTAISDSTPDEGAGGAGELNAIYAQTQSGNGSACNGDSGGPLVVGGTVIGVVSNGGTCGPGQVVSFASVSAGENLTFIRNVVDGTANPIPPAPRGGRDVTLTGPASPQAGDLLTCAAGTWSGGPSYVYTFTDTRNGAVLQSSSSTEYRLTAGDVGRTISCSATATTAGGVGRTPATQATPAVRAAPTPAPTPTPSPTPTPAPTPTPTPTPKPAPTPDPARLSTSVTSGSSKVRQGARVSFRVTVRNTGDLAAKTVKACVRVGQRFSIVSRGGATLTGGRLCWSISQLGGATTRQRVSATRTLRFSLRADRDAKAGRTTAATVSLTAPGVRSASARRVVTIQRRAVAPSPGGVTG